MDMKKLASELAEKSELKPEEAESFVESLFVTIGDHFKKGEKVVIAEFGSFFVRDDKTIQFSPSAKLKDLVG